MKTKSKNVRIGNLHPLLKISIPHIESICKEVEGDKYEMTITSGNDGIHKPKSYHYKNRAIDIRSRDMTKPKKVTELLTRMLGKKFDVILEKDHIHIELDKL